MCEQTDPKPEATALQSLSVQLVVPVGDDSLLTFATTLLKMKNNNGKWHTNNGCAIFFLLFPFKVSTLSPWGTLFGETAKAVRMTHFDQWQQHFRGSLEMESTC